MSDDQSNVLADAKRMFESNSNWVAFFRDVFAAEGLIDRAYPSTEQRDQFERTSDYVELQEMLAALRSNERGKGTAIEAEKMITVRMPASLHKSLTAEAEQQRLSINKLCITKLLQRVEGRFIPIQQGRVRGRRPGPQGPRKRLGKDGDSNHRDPGANSDETAQRC